MNLTQLLGRIEMRPRVFIAAGIAIIALTRLAVIALTPGRADLPDLRIYQSAGQAVLAGVNPYDFQDRPPLREELRARVAHPSEAQDFAGSLASWNYYVSSNLPASTALYGSFEGVSGGSRPVWRLLFILGDIAIFLGALALLRALGLGYQGGLMQLGVVSLVVLNPILIVSGCAIPEDKQFQTALMLFAAALLLAPPAGARRNLLGGLVLSLAVLFKFFGAFLLPLWFSAARSKGSRFVLWSVVGGLIPLAVSFAWFGHHFLATMAARGVSNSVSGPEHASPWVLLPWLAGYGYLFAKITAAAAFCSTLVWLSIRKRIDLLNFCAGLAVIFACLWLDKGAMNRMNIAVLFAVVSLASLNVRVFAAFAVSLAASSAAAYVLGVGLLRVELARVDAMLAGLFVLAYWVVLVLHGSLRSGAGSSSTAAAGG